MPFLESRETFALDTAAAQWGSRSDCQLIDFNNKFSIAVEPRAGDGPASGAHKRPWSAPAAPRQLPRSTQRRPMNLPRIARQPPPHLPGAALADCVSGFGAAAASTVVNGGERYPAPRASDSFSVSRSSHASSAEASSSRAASSAVEVRAKPAGSRP